jgi:FMN-dependent NADH-azoreductase
VLERPFAEPRPAAPARGRDRWVHSRPAAKRVIVAISRGGFYGSGTPAAVGEYLETYLRWVFGFIGIRNPEFISADSIQVGAEHRGKAVANALNAASNLNAA